MTPSRYSEVENEARRRLRLYLQNKSFEEMCSNSFVVFAMNMRMYSVYEHEPWMDKNDFFKYVTDYEFEHDDDYVDILSDLFYEAMNGEFK
jgi:hypothetical protein